MQRMDRRAFVLGASASLVGVGPLGRLAAAAAAREDARIAELRRLVHGPVLARGDARYAQAHRLYDPTWDRVRPLAVLEAVRVADVQAAVRWAVRHGIRIVARSGGHSYLGQSTASGGLVVDLRRLQGVRADPATQTAVVEAGARLVDVYAALAARGVTIPAGSCPGVGIAGLALGGGIGLAGRALGLTSDRLIAADVVLADGSLVRATARRHADLRWALRGGGGGTFGIVTRLFLRTAPTGGRAAIAYAHVGLDHADELLRRFADLAPHAEDAATLDCTVSAGGVAIVGQHLRDEARLAALVGSLTSGLAPDALHVRTVPYADVARIWAGCEHLSRPQCRTAALEPGGVLDRERFVAGSDLVSRPLSAAGRRAIVHAAAQGRGAAIIDALGGRIGRLPADATAFPHRDALLSVQWYAGYEAGGASAAAAWIRAAKASFRPHATGGAYVNYQDAGLAGWDRAYFGANLPRLVAVKRAYDPGNVFRGRQTVHP